MKCSTGCVPGKRTWRQTLGKAPEAGVFIGAETWRRISEVWEPPDPDDIDAAIEVAARLGDYVFAIEPIQARLTNRLTESDETGADRPSARIRPNERWLDVRSSEALA